MRYCGEMQRIDAARMASRLREDAAGTIAMAEQAYHDRIGDVTGQILSGHHRIVLLTGPSSSGKTTTAKLIQARLAASGKTVHRISLDNFYRPYEEMPRWNDGYVNYESIDGLDIPEFNRLVYQLKQTGYAEFPIYDFSVSKRLEETFPVTFDESTYIIFEGIHALNPKLLDGQFSEDQIFRIYVSVHSDFVSGGEILLAARPLRLLRRILRDAVYRNTDPVKTLELWEYVRRGEEEYIKPFRRYADYHLNSTHSYEPFVYAQRAVELLGDPEAAGPYTETVRSLLDAVRRFCPVSPSLIPQDSLLQEFIS